MYDRVSFISYVNCCNVCSYRNGAQTVGYEYDKSLGQYNCTRQCVSQNKLCARILYRYYIREVTEIIKSEKNKRTSLRYSSACCRNFPQEFVYT